MSWVRPLSRWLHRILGLILIPYGVLMGVTGILVNHPEWTADVSLPPSLVPEPYRANDFERHTLRTLLFARSEPSQAYLAGSEGVWRSTDGARTFQAFDDGFPSSAAGRDTHALLLIEEPDREFLLAGTEAGLYATDLTSEPPRWTPVDLGAPREPVRSLLRVDSDVLAVTPSTIHRADALRPTNFEPVTTRRRLSEDSGARNVSLITFCFDLHSGAFFGYAGKLVYDLVGVLVAFLSLSAFYLWYHPRRTRLRKRGTQRKRRSGPTFGRSLFRWLLSTHLKIGIWMAPIVLLMSLTGLFMRPPLILLPASGRLDASLHPALAPLESFDGRIRRAVHDRANARILLETTDGFWASDENLERPFEEIELGLPVHVMGTNVLAVDDRGGVVAGSFSGGFRLDPATREVRELESGDTADEVSRLRLAPRMVTGYFETPEGERFLATFREGILPLGDAERAGRFQMPPAMRERQTLSLWKFAFELHNQRYFSHWIGIVSFLLPILGSLLFLVLTLTGIYDWSIPRLRRRAERQRLSSKGVK